MKLKVAGRGGQSNRGPSRNRYVVVRETDGREVAYVNPSPVEAGEASLAREIVERFNAGEKRAESSPALPDRPIVTGHSPGPWEALPGGDLRIGGQIVSVGYRGSRGRTAPNRAANAMLMAAGPDLLSVSKDILLLLFTADGDIGGMGASRTYRILEGRLREAVTKATGIPQ